MSVLCDAIESHIKMLIAEAGQAELRRNDLALKFRCAPSQINYVLSTRFAPNLGYYIQSKRGGGGYIRVVRININAEAFLMEQINHALGKSLGQREAWCLVERLSEMKVLSASDGALMVAAVSDKALPAAGQNRDEVRADILRQMLLAVANRAAQGG